MAGPVEEFELQERERDEAEEDDESKEEDDESKETGTSFMDAEDDFFRFLVDGPREYPETSKGDPLPVFQAWSEKQYRAKQEVLYKLFGETFDRRFGDKMTFFMNRVRPIRDCEQPR